MSVPDPSIAEIERAVRKARFEESATDKLLRKRSDAVAIKASVEKYNDQKLRLAYQAGYREAWAKARPRTVAFYSVYLTLFVVTIAALIIGRLFF